MPRKKKNVIEHLEDLRLTPEQRESLSKMINEAVDAKDKIEGYKRLITDITERAQDELELGKAHFNKLVNMVHKDNMSKTDKETNALLDILDQTGFYIRQEE